MSLETWKAEFYPIPADKVPVEEAVQHSLRKWRGLTKKNLKKHEVRLIGSIVCDNENSLGIDAKECSLCVHYFENPMGLLNTCVNCPLAKSLGYPCDSISNNGPYLELDNSNPLPMIKALEKAAALEPDIRGA